MRKCNVYSLLVVFALVAAFSASTFAQLDGTYKQTLQTTTDEAVLIDALQKGGDAPDDIFRVNLACKRLAVLGTDAALPALVKLLTDEKQAFNAQTALEAMKGKTVDATLQKAAQELKGALGAGVIAVIGNRKDVSAIPVLKQLLAQGPDPLVKKAIFAALGFMGTDEVAEILLAELKAGKKDNNDTVWNGLGDAMLDCAEAAEKAGKTEKALLLYDAIVNPAFPVAIQKAAAYHGLLTRKGDSATTLLDKMQSPNTCCFTGGIKTIREFDAKDAEPIVKALLAELPKLCDERKVLVIRAIGDRTDDVSRELLLPVLIEQGKVGSPELNVAILKTYATAAQKKPTAFLHFLVETQLGAIGAPYSEPLVQTAVALPGKEIDHATVKVFEKIADTDEFLKPEGEQTVLVAKSLLQIIELRRIAELAPGLVQVVNAPGVNGEVRDAALAALSEVVTLDSLNLLVKALDDEKDEKKVDWILRSACTRLPREDCAAAVVKLFDVASLEEKIKMMGLIKQIGGKTAVKCIADACWQPDTIDAASEVLGQWNTPEDIDDVAVACLKLANEAPNNKYHVRGIRSYVRIPRQFNMPLEKRIEMCKVAFDTAARPEDKALIFDVLARQTEVGAVIATLAYANDEAFKERACTTAVAIAEKINIQKGTPAAKTLVDAMISVQTKMDNADLKARAQKVIDRLK